jgi:hypothetical protein
MAHCQTIDPALSYCSPMIGMGIRVKFEVDQDHPTPDQEMLAPSYKQSDCVGQETQAMNLSQLTLSLPQITFSHLLIQLTILVFR